MPVIVLILAGLSGALLLVVGTMYRELGILSPISFLVSVLIVLLVCVAVRMVRR